MKRSARIEREQPIARASRASVIAIAQQVGYDTDAAFNRAFKREFGMPPAAWRREQLRA